MADDLEALAKAGDLKATETIMNQTFGSQGVNVQITETGSSLEIILTGATLPNRSLVNPIKRGLNETNLQGFDKVILQAQCTQGQETWNQEWRLKPQKPDKWYKSPVMIILALAFVCAPVALVIEEQSSTFRLNEKVEEGDSTIIIKSAEKVDGQKINAFPHKPIEGEFVLVYFLAKNSSNEGRYLQFNSLKLMDSKGRKYNEYGDGAYLVWRDRQDVSDRGEEYYPGEARKEVMAFRIAPGADGFSLLWDTATIDLTQ